MLPVALPLFLCPRIAASLSTKISGRALLTIGRLVVAAGNFATAAAVVTHMPYAAVAIGMLLTGCGAGLLNMVAGVIAALAAALTFAFVSGVETAPDRMLPSGSTGAARDSRLVGVPITRLLGNG